MCMRSLPRKMSIKCEIELILRKAIEKICSEIYYNTEL